MRRSPTTEVRAAPLTGATVGGRVPVRVVTMALALALLAGACVATPHATYDGSTDLRPQTLVLTPDGFDTYTFISGPGFAQFRARPDNRAGNLRQVFWPSDGPDVVDQQSCATWTATDPGDTQQGAALRISAADGRVRAVTVTKNVLYFTQWQFNVHIWDTSQQPQPFTLVGQIDLRDELWPQQQLAALPWHLCARVIGAVVDLKVWLDGEAEPAWGDPFHGGSVVLPDGWVYPGQAGWYVGHLIAGQAAGFGDLRTWQYTFTPAPVPTTGPENLPPTSAATRAGPTGRLITASLG